MGRRFQRDRRIEKTRRFEENEQRREKRRKNERSPADAMRGFEPDASIDLHGLHPDEALRRTSVMLESPEYRGKTLMVIHGKGLNGKSYGTLRSRVRELGASSRFVKRVWNGEDVFLPGGDGVTVFFL